MSSSLLRQVLHVLFHELNLCVQISVPLVGVLEFFLKLEVLHLKLVNMPFRFLLLVFVFLVGLGQLVQLVLELAEFGLKGGHGAFVSAAIVL